MNKQIPSCANCKYVKYENYVKHCSYAQVEQVDRFTGKIKIVRPSCKNECTTYYKGSDRNPNIPLCGMEGKNFEYNDSMKLRMINFIGYYKWPLIYILILCGLILNVILHLHEGQVTRDAMEFLCIGVAALVVPIWYIPFMIND